MTVYPLATVTFVDVAVSLVPVFVFLTALVLLDSYKLVKLRSVLVSVGFGCAAALICHVLYPSIAAFLALDDTIYRRYVAPVVEECIKALYLMYLIQAKRVGFMVDAAIHGFALGAGFALVENTYYLEGLAASSPVVWVIRGFGTAVMHGGATAIFGLTAKTISDRTSTANLRAWVPGLLIAIVLHSLYNHFFFSPLISPLMILIVLPPLLIVVFQQSEKLLRRWLHVGFDTDQDLLRMITSGNVLQTPVGEYLKALQKKFAPEVVIDVFCYLRLHIELTIAAKGMLLMRQAGFEVPPDAAVREKFAELRALTRSIGQTGKLALLPFLHISGRELWELHMLEQK